MRSRVRVLRDSLWRGRHRSFEAERLVAEALRLEAQGTVELNLVAQDLAPLRPRVPGRHRHLDAGRAPGRSDRDPMDPSALHLLGRLREPLIRLMASEPRILPYIDMPIQHASDPVLERMRRPERQESLREKIAWLRDAVPGLTLRTTVLVGLSRGNG